MAATDDLPPSAIFCSGIASSSAFFVLYNLFVTEYWRPAALLPHSSAVSFTFSLKAAAYLGDARLLAIIVVYVPRRVVLLHRLLNIRYISRTPLGVGVIVVLLLRLIPQQIR